MKWHRWQQTVQLTVEAGPVFTFTPTNVTQRIRVGMVWVRWHEDRISEVRLTGPAVREDGSEVHWQTPVYRLTRPAERPDWLVSLMEAEGWEWT